MRSAAFPYEKKRAEVRGRSMAYVDEDQGDLTLTRFSGSPSSSVQADRLFDIGVCRNTLLEPINVKHFLPKHELSTEDDGEPVLWYFLNSFIKPILEQRCATSYVCTNSGPS